MTIQFIPRSQAPDLYVHRYEVQQQQVAGNWNTIIASNYIDTANYHAEYAEKSNRGAIRIIDNEE